MDLKEFYSFSNVKRLSKALKQGWKDFPEKTFLNGLEKQLTPLELKERLHLLTDRLIELLPADYPTKVRIVLSSLAQNEADEVGVRGFLVWPLSNLISREGLHHPELSLKALKEITSRFTSEFDVRPFLELHQELTLHHLRRWAKDPDPHVRRWVSEGTRPLLPWGSRLRGFQQKPEITRDLLEALMLDESEYVRKSVANHLNDHSKSHPEWTLQFLHQWQKKHPDHPGVTWIVRHASRSLIKQGHPQALKLLGFVGNKNIKVELVSLTPRKVVLGGALQVRVQLKNTAKRPQAVMLDYVIFHKKAAGHATPKVFKGRVKTLAPGETWVVDLKHPMRPITTRKYFAGLHEFAWQVNGVQGPRQKFQLKL